MSELKTGKKRLQDVKEGVKEGKERREGGRG